jgi:hypothetical protein
MRCSSLLPADFLPLSVTAMLWREWVAMSSVYVFQENLARIGTAGFEVGRCQTALMLSR